VQQVIHIESGRSILKLTAARYLRPSGKNIHRREGAGEDEEWGVSPEDDLLVSLTDQEHLAWAKARRDRDTNGGPPTGGDGPAPYAWDVQLQRAIDAILQTSKVSAM
jgi:carboxyl-terminal processing protease